MSQNLSFTNSIHPEPATYTSAGDETFEDLNIGLDSWLYNLTEPIPEFHHPATVVSSPMTIETCTPPPTSERIRKETRYPASRIMA
jgi:hypothetical protein